MFGASSTSTTNGTITTAREDERVRELTEEIRELRKKASAKETEAEQAEHEAEQAEAEAADLVEQGAENRAVALRERADRHRQKAEELRGEIREIRTETAEVLAERDELRAEVNEKAQRQVDARRAELLRDLADVVETLVPLARRRRSLKTNFREFVASTPDSPTIPQHVNRWLTGDKRSGTSAVQFVEAAREQADKLES